MTLEASDLLLPMEAEAFQTYHKALVRSVLPLDGDLKVVPDVGAGDIGKGLVACRDYTVGDRLFTEPPLVGEQHSTNRSHALVCDQCFRYLGPLEFQLGFRLLQSHVVASGADEETLDTQADTEPPVNVTPGHDDAVREPTSSHCILRTALALLRKKSRVPSVDWEPESGCPTPCTGGYIPLHLQQLLLKSQAEDCSGFLPVDAVRPQEPLLGRAIRLPDGSDYLFCSHDCAGHTCGTSGGPLLSQRWCTAALAWVTWAALLSPGPPRHLPPAVRSSPFVEDFDVRQVGRPAWQACTLGGRLHSFGGVHGEDGAAPNIQGSSVPAGEPPVATSQAHATAARAVAMVVSAWCMRVAVHAHGSGGEEPQGGERQQMILEAWQPFQAVFKAVWWEQVPMPEDLSDEASWRAQLRSLACESLQLLKAALPAVPPQLVADEVWGSIIGMFELNNLALQVQSPLELFFLAVDELPHEQQAAVQPITQPWLDALDTDYGACCSGTALYALQSCMNHSGTPNAGTQKEDGDMDGKAVISAAEDICAGDEVRISYVDLSAPEAEQRCALRDYGIVA